MGTLWLLCCLVSDNDIMQCYIMEHFVFPGNIDFATDDRCTFMFYSWKADVFVIHCLWNNVYDWWITSNSHANDTEQEAQQVAGNPHRGRFSTKTPLENADWNSLARGSKKTTTKIGQWRQRRQHSNLHKHVQRQWQHTTYTVNKTDEETEHRLPTLQKATRRSGNGWSLHSKLSSSMQW